MRNILFSLVIILFATGAVTAADIYPYIPLQPALTGDWYNPERNGEGLDISLIPATDETDEEGNVVGVNPPVLWVKLYGLSDEGESGWWAVAQGTISGSWYHHYDDYAFWLVGPGNVRMGHITLKVVDGGESILMDYYVNVDGKEYVVYATQLFQLVKGSFHDYVGYCNHHLTFSPPYPAIQDQQWCPHIYY